MKACRNCRYLVNQDKTCPKCNNDLSEKFFGVIIVLDPEHSEVAKIAEINSVGSYAIRVK